MVYVVKARYVTVIMRFKCRGECLLPPVPKVVRFDQARTVGISAGAFNAKWPLESCSQHFFSWISPGFAVFLRLALMTQYACLKNSCLRYPVCMKQPDVCVLSQELEIIWNSKA